MWPAHVAEAAHAVLPCLAVPEGMPTVYGLKVQAWSDDASMSPASCLGIKAAEEEIQQHGTLAPVYGMVGLLHVCFACLEKLHCRGHLPHTALGCC